MSFSLQVWEYQSTTGERRLIAAPNEDIADFEAISRDWRKMPGGEAKVPWKKHEIPTDYLLRKSGVDVIVRNTTLGAHVHSQLHGRVQLENQILWLIGKFEAANRRIAELEIENDRMRSRLEQANTRELKEQLNAAIDSVDSSPSRYFAHRRYTGTASKIEEVTYEEAKAIAREENEAYRRAISYSTGPRYEHARTRGIDWIVWEEVGTARRCVITGKRTKNYELERK